MKTYKVYTKWVGYSEIEVNAENEQEAHIRCISVNDFHALEHVR